MCHVVLVFGIWKGLRNAFMEYLAAITGKKGVVRWVSMDVYLKNAYCAIVDHDRDLVLGLIEFKPVTTSLFIIVWQWMEIFQLSPIRTWGLSFSALTLGLPTLTAAHTEDLDV